jgi:hypothetical protein
VLEKTPLAQWVQGDTYAFPALEAAHVVAVILVFGSIAMLDLRLLGVSSRNHAVTKLASEVVPWTWTSFTLAVVTGALLFLGQASSYFANREFRIKMVLLALAGVNLVVFHAFAWRSVHRWNTGTPTPVGAKAAAALSLILWIGVVIAGRWIGWTLAPAPP